MEHAHDLQTRKYTKRCQAEVSEFVPIALDTPGRQLVWNVDREEGMVVRHL